MAAYGGRARGRLGHRRRADGLPARRACALLGARLPTRQGRGAAPVDARRAARRGGAPPARAPPRRPGRAAAADGGPSLAYLAARWPLGLLGALVLLTALVGALYASTAAWAWWASAPTTILSRSSPPVSAASSCCSCRAGLSFGVAALDAGWPGTSSAPASRSCCERRIERAGRQPGRGGAAVDDERRRIERDLHDGVQQRLVALAMLLGRARRSRDADAGRRAAAPGARGEPAGADRAAGGRLAGLPDGAGRARAARGAGGVAERSALPVRSTTASPSRRRRPWRPRRTSSSPRRSPTRPSTRGARRITVTACRRRRRRDVVVRVDDDGTGGADPAGSGLPGWRGRVVALDGRFAGGQPRRRAHHDHRGAAVRRDARRRLDPAARGAGPAAHRGGPRGDRRGRRRRALLAAVDARPAGRRRSWTSGCRPRTPTRACAPRWRSASAGPAIGVLVLSQYVERHYADRAARGDRRRRRLPAQGPGGGGRGVPRRAGAGRRGRGRLRPGGGPAAAGPHHATPTRSRRLTPREREVLDRGPGPHQRRHRRSSCTSRRARSRSTSTRSSTSSTSPRTTGYSRRVLAVLRYLSTPAGE